DDVPGRLRPSRANGSLGPERGGRDGTHRARALGRAGPDRAGKRIVPGAIATGQADDLLATLCLATEAPIAVAPAMNRLMWANAATQENIATLRSRRVSVFGPADGDQACGEV